MRLAEFFKAVQRFLQDVQRGAVADTNALVIAEGDAGNGGHLVAFQELVAQVQGGEAQLAGVHKEVEGALGFHDADVRDGAEAGILSCFYARKIPPP